MFAGPITWLKEEEPARAAAIAQKKPVIIDFGAEWCKACKELDEVTWPDPRVRGEISRFVAIKADATDDDNEETKRLTKKYNVRGLPTVVVLDSEGVEKVRFTEFVDANKLAAAIKDIK